MAAAGLGNLVSDIAGVGMGGVVEKFTHSVLRVPHPSIPPHLEQTFRVKRMKIAGQMVGLTIGCLLGLFPLFFMTTKEQNEKEKEKEREKAIQHG